MPTPTYISVSRRTDIPRFFAGEFFAAWKRGSVTYAGGYGRTYSVSLLPQDVLGYIFWSKDYNSLLAHQEFPALIAANNALFHFTINDCPDLEPAVAPLGARLDVMRRLCDAVGPQRVLWRYDPVCMYRTRNGSLRTSEDAFYRLLPVMQELGVRRCYFSFVALYNKLRSRPVRFESMPNEEKARIASSMLAAASDANIELLNCCNPEVLDLVPGIRKGRCIDDEVLRATDRFGVHPKDGLRSRPTREGCGCYASRDIGSYTQACAHGCAYCYARPVSGYSAAPPTEVSTCSG
jgi:hypothetical protein